MGNRDRGYFLTYATRKIAQGCIPTAPAFENRLFFNLSQNFLNHLSSFFESVYIVATAFGNVANTRLQIVCSIGILLFRQ
jgi:hypothetical protein